MELRNRVHAALVTRPHRPRACPARRCSGRRTYLPPLPTVEFGAWARKTYLTPVLLTPVLRGCGSRLHPMVTAAGPDAMIQGWHSGPHCAFIGPRKGVPFSAMTTRSCRIEVRKGPPRRELPGRVAAHQPAPPRDHPRLLRVRPGRRRHRRSRLARGAGEARPARPARSGPARQARRYRRGGRAALGACANASSRHAMPRTS